MTKKTATILAATVALMVPMAAAAHHSFAAQYDGNRPITLKGTIIRMEWTNPHGHLWIDVKAEDGNIVRWEIETAATGALIRRGWKKSDLPAGKEVIVRGFLARDGSANANGTTVRLAETGQDLFSGSAGPGAAPGEPPQ